MIVNDNVIDLVIEPGEKPGEPAKVTARPESAYYQVDALDQHRFGQVDAADSIFADFAHAIRRPRQGAGGRQAAGADPDRR